MTRLTPKSLGATALLLTLATPASLAGPSSTPPPAGSFAQEVDLAGEVEDIIEEFDEADAAFYKLMKEAGSDEERQELWDANRIDYAAFAARLDAVVKKDPADPAAVTAIAWILRNSDSRGSRDGYLALLMEHHLESDGLGSICSSLSSDAVSERFLRSVMDKSKSHDAVGRATYALANLLGGRIRLQERLSSASQEDVASYKEWLGEATVALCVGLDADAVGIEQRALLEKVRDEFKDVISYGDRTIADSAAGELFELDHLQLGMVAPEITGPDLDGIEFKLSDYRGQVVFLDFWGDW